MPIIARTLVLDTNVFLRRMPFWEIAEKFVTTPGVMNEVRDEESQLWLSNLPVTIDVASPSKVSIGRVQTFSRATGDFASLSAEDVEVIALGFELDVAAHENDNHLRIEPAFKNPASMKTFTEGKHSASTAPLGSYGDNKQYRNRLGQHRQQTRVGEVDPMKEQKYAEYKQSLLDDDMLQLIRARGPMSAATNGGNDNTNAGTFADAPDNGEGEWLDVIPQEFQQAMNPASLCWNERVESKDPIVLEARVDDAIIADSGNGTAGAVTGEGEGEWVTPENFMQDTLATVQDDGCIVPVATCTSDYSMQNVIMQMGLRLASPHGIIKEFKRYAGKCSACLNISPVLDSSFCKKCGNRTMMKVSMYVREDGVATFSAGIKHFNLRGTVFSLPCFASKKYLGKAGRRTIVPISSANDPNAEYILGLQGRSRFATGSAGVQHFTADIKGPASTKGGAIVIPHYLKHNPNESKRGKKHYSKHI